MAVIRDTAAAVYEIGAGVALFIEREAGQTLVSLVLMAGAIGIMDAAARGQFAHDIGMIGLGFLGRTMGSGKK